MTTLLTEADIKNLQSLKKADDDEWCRGTWAYSALVALHMTQEEIQINWPKLFGRRSEDVKECVRILKKEDPEHWQRILSRFAKDHKEVRSTS